MRVPALAFLPTLSFVAIGYRGAEPLSFKRTFKQGVKESFTYKTGPHGSQNMFVCQYTQTVTAVTANGSSVAFQILKMEAAGLGESDAVPPLTSKVGFDNMPAAASIKSGNEFLLFGSLAGFTPNVAANVGGTITASWQNAPKDVKFDISGKLASTDPVAKTLTVEWNIEMTPSYTTGGKFKLTSIYELADFSLLKSTGTFTIGSTVMDVNVTRG